MDPFARMFAEMLGVPVPQSVSTGQSHVNTLSIPVNFYETRENVIIELGLPGYSREDLEVSIHGRRLHLVAKSRKCETFQESKVHSHNFGHVDLDRDLELPDYLDTSNVNVSMNDGLLRLVVQRRSDEVQKLPILTHIDQHFQDKEKENNG